MSSRLKRRGIVSVIVAAQSFHVWYKGASVAMELAVCTFIKASSMLKYIEALEQLPSHLSQGGP